MNEKFLELIECLIGRKPTGLIENYREDLNAIVERFNNTLNYSNEDKKFVSSYYSNEAILAPVPFSALNEKTNIVFFGLNPGIDTGENEITKIEKELAGETWEEYANFYTSDTITNFTINNPGQFLRNQVSVIATLKKQQYVGWTDFNNGLNNEERSNSINELFQDHLGVESIPFHSNKFGLGERELRKLAENIPEYDDYLNRLLQTIDDSLAPDGWIVCNGKNACNSFQYLVSSSESYNNFETIKDLRGERSYSFHFWNSRKVILCHRFMRSQASNLNSNEEIQRMLEDAIDTFKSASPQIKNASLAVELEENTDNPFNSFGDYTNVAKVIDNYILNVLDYTSHRIETINNGFSYNERPIAINRFAKLDNTNNDYKLLLSFGQTATSDKLGWYKQLEIDKKFNTLNKRPLANIKNKHNEAWIYLDSIDLNDERIMSLLKSFIKEAYECCYK